MIKSPEALARACKMFNTSHLEPEDDDQEPEASRDLYETCVTKKDFDFKSFLNLTNE